MAELLVVSTVDIVTENGATEKISGVGPWFLLLVGLMGFKV